MHSSAFRLAALGLIFASAPIFSGIEDLTILVSPDGTQVAGLAGDIHDRKSGTQTDRLVEAILSLQKEDPTPLRVGIEVPGNLFATPSRILAQLAPTLKAFRIPGLNVKNSEIRAISGLAFWLFGRKNLSPINPNTVLTIAGKQCIIGKPTFTDLKTEFEELYTPLPRFAQTLPDQEKKLFEYHLNCATAQMERFQAEIEGYTHPSNAILATAVNLARYQDKRISVHKREKIAQAVFAPFASLFNLTVLRDILSGHSKQLYLAGILHTTAIKEFLLELHWKVHPGKNAEQSSKYPETVSFESPISYLKSTTEE